MKGISQNLLPTKAIIMLFSLFIFLMWVSNTQSWGFNGEVIGLEKPLFFDIVNRFPYIVTLTIIVVMFIISSPLLLLTFTIEKLIGLEASSILGSGLLSMLIYILYFYLLSCALVFIYNIFLKKRRIKL